MRVWIVVSALATAALMAVLLLLLHLRTDNVPHGVISLQLAESPAAAKAIVQDWRVHGLIDRAVWNLRLDYLLILAYVTFGVLLNRRSKCGVAAALAAGVLDIVENVILLRELSGHIRAGSVSWVAGAAMWKFGLIASAIAYGLFRAVRQPAPATRGSGGPAGS